MTSTSAGTDSAQTPQTALAVRRGRGFTSAGPPLLLAGVCFALYPALRPFSDEKSLNGARAFASTRWLVAHSLGIAAFILLAVGLFAVYEHIQDTTAHRTARAGLLLSWIGVGLVLPYYGAEVFGLHAAGQQALTTGDTGTFDTLIHAIRWEAASGSSSQGCSCSPPARLPSRLPCGARPPCPAGPLCRSPP